MIVGDGLARPVLYNGLRMLVTDGEIRREGKGRNTRYMKIEQYWN